MFPTIDILAKDIDAAWSRVNYAEENFCEIAAAHLNRTLDLDFATVALRVCQGAVLPEQRRLDEAFGQPALTLYSGPHFQIEALCWHSGSPAIHQHAFSGAFRVLTGQSVHSRYSFIECDHLGQLTLGDLRLDNVELLDSNSIVQIPRGEGLIHSTFHLDSPTMTLVVRTHQTSASEPTYLPPGVAYESSARSPSLHKRLQLLDTLNQTASASYIECVRAAIDHSDAYAGMAVVMRTGSHVDQPTFLSFTQRLRERHGSKTSLVVAALVEEKRRSTIVRLRSAVTDKDGRFFLATLLSFSRRRDLLNAMVQRYHDPIIARHHIVDGVAGLLGGDSDRQIVTATAADAILDGVPASLFPERAARVWQRPINTQEMESLERFYSQILEHPLLTPLRPEVESHGNSKPTQDLRG